jgi:hypothetical protein
MQGTPQCQLQQAYSFAVGTLQVKFTAVDEVVEPYESVWDGRRREIVDKDARKEAKWVGSCTLD